MTITCACGAKVIKRVNANGVVLCPRCGSAHTPAEFNAPTGEEVIEHDFTRR
jgi:hypothetical protein